MINMETKLTADDLIVEYMMYKVRNGYESSFTASEFMSFLQYFETKMEVFDVIYDKKLLFKRFFEREIKKHWTLGHDDEQVIVPSMNMKYDDTKKDLVISATYHLSEYDRSVINTYFMDGGMGKYMDHKGRVYQIRSIIGEFLKDCPKRKIDTFTQVTSKELSVAKILTAEIINDIWNNYIDDLIDRHMWPKQCNDINKYLFDFDLGYVIGVPSIKDELINLYRCVYKRLAVLYHEDKELEVCSFTNKYLGRANYELLFQGFEKTINKVYGSFKKDFLIELHDDTYRQEHKIDIPCYFDDDPDFSTEEVKEEDIMVRKLVGNMDSTILKD